MNCEGATSEGHGVLIGSRVERRQSEGQQPNRKRNEDLHRMTLRSKPKGWWVEWWNQKWPWNRRGW